jgi:hypothetical protein
MRKLELLRELQGLDAVHTSADYGVLHRSPLEFHLSSEEGAKTLCSSKRRWLFECLEEDYVVQLNLVFASSALTRRGFEAMLAAVGQQRVCFCGDLDPNDLAVALSILEGGIAGNSRVDSGLAVQWVGVGDEWITAFESQVGPLDHLLGTMSAYERQVWNWLKHHQVPERLGLGDRSLQILNAGKMLDIDALVHRRLGAEFTSVLRALVAKGIAGQP